MGGHWSKTGLPIWPVMYIQLTLYWLDVLFLLVFFFFGGEGFFFSYNFFLFFSIILSLIRRWEWCGSGGEEKQCVIWMES